MYPDPIVAETAFGRLQRKAGTTVMKSNTNGLQKNHKISRFFNFCPPAGGLTVDLRLPTFTFLNKDYERHEKPGSKFSSAIARSS